MKTFGSYLAVVLFGGVLGLFFSLMADRLTGVSFDTIAPKTEIIAVLPVYDNPQTKRLVGYLDLYDSSEGLLLVRWVDRFGIRRTAMDRRLEMEGRNLRWRRKVRRIPMDIMIFTSIIASAIVFLMVWNIYDSWLAWKKSEISSVYRYWTDSEGIFMDAMLLSMVVLAAVSLMVWNLIVS